MLRKRLVLAVISLTILASLLGGGILLTSAQSDAVVLTLVISGFEAELFPEEALREFEAQNPGIKVVIKESNSGGFLVPAAGNLDAHLEDAETWVTEGDVILMDDSSLSLEATRAGLFLDLRPLVSADPTINEADFFPAIWQSVQWDNGIWGIPLSADLIFLTYLPSKFDAAGVPYPNENWTINDIITAADLLSERDADGNITQSGLASDFVFGGESLLFRALLNQGVYDDSFLPSQANFTNPELSTLIQTWYDEVTPYTNVVGENRRFNETALQLTSSFGLQRFGDGEQPQPALLPNGYAGLSVRSAVVSSGTIYPEQAYQLAKFLSTRTEVIESSFNSYTPARQSLVGIEAPAQEGGVVIRRAGGSADNLLPEHQAFLTDALQRALPVSEMRFMNYAAYALNLMEASGTDAATALQDAEQVAIDNLQTATQLAQDNTIFVATPVPTPVLSSSEVAIKFGLQSFINPLPNQEDWDTAINNFVASDAEIGQVVFDSSFPNTASSWAENYDCFYVPNNLAQSTDTQYLLNVDPFVDADPSFNRDDLVGNILSQLQKDSKTWGVPITVQPQVMKYHYEEFLNHGVIPPENGWTIDQFVDALHQLKTNPDDDAPYASQSFGVTNLQMLIAAYGGVPIDYRTDPPTINFTDPNTVTAIQQVLDLAKNGYINYQETANLGGFIFITGDDQEILITDEALNAFAGPGRGPRGGGGGNNPDDPYSYTTFPTGNQYNAISYDVGAGYISATTPYAEACYRWLAYISQQPSLFTSMPARRSVIQMQNQAGTTDPDVIALYDQFDQAMQNPNNLNFPSIFSGATSPASFLMQYWLGKAFDQYVLEDADLQTVLEEQELYAKAYVECVAALPPFDPANGDQGDFVQQYLDCGITADSSLSEILPN